MGTRHNIEVTVNDKKKVSQYGQWDGYPTGQGETIAEFLRTADLKKFRSQVWRTRAITKKEIEMVNNTPNWQKEYPYLSRDAGADILNMIYEGEVKFVLRNEDMSWCEYLYEIDLDKETVTMNGFEFPFSIWTADGFMEQLEIHQEEWYEEEG